MGFNKIKSYEAFESKGGWAESEGKLVKRFGFDGFTQALSFINRVAEEAEALQHHPEIRWEYDKITILLSTHDAGSKVTEKDFELARAIDRVES